MKDTFLLKNEANPENFTHPPAHVEKFDFPRMAALETEGWFFIHGGRQGKRYGNSKS